MRRRGLTLVEILVAATLLLLLLGLAGRALVAGFRVSVRGAQEASLQSQATVSLNWIVGDLQRTCPAELAFLTPAAAGDPAGLGMIRWTGQTTAKGTLLWEQQLVAYLWLPQQGRLVRRVYPPAPPALPLTFDPVAPPPLSSTHLEQLANCPTATQRTLASDVKLFSASGGATVVVRLELESKTVSGELRERFQLQRSVAMRTL